RRPPRRRPRRRRRRAIRAQTSPAPRGRPRRMARCRRRADGRSGSVGGRRPAPSGRPHDAHHRRRRQPVPHAPLPRIRRPRPRRPHRTVDPRGRLLPARRPWHPARRGRRRGALMPATLTAVVALLARDLRAFLRSRSQLYSSVLFPLMLLALLGTGVSEGLDPKNIRDYVTFLTPGMIVMTAVFSSTFSSATYYQDRDSGMLKVLFASPHSQRTILFAKTLSAVVI